nr:polycomb group RING finger protein 3 isoform X2 [Caretta caretta]
MKPISLMRKQSLHSLNDSRTALWSLGIYILSLKRKVTQTGIHKPRPLPQPFYHQQPYDSPRNHRRVQVKTPKMLTRKIKLWDINAHITCRLCNGYLIDATTVTECLHTFMTEQCKILFTNLCQAFKMVSLAEMRKQREFYHKLGMEVPGDIKGETCSAKQHLDSHRNGETKADESSNKETSEEKQEEDNDYHRSDEQVSICLECNSSKLRGLKRKWIRCSAQATVLHLKKFIAKKLNLSSFNELDILCNEEILGKDHTLKFVVVTRWRFKKAPLLLHYRPKMDLL